jgi:hypothetical protein
MFASVSEGGNFHLSWKVTSGIQYPLNSFNPSGLHSKLQINPQGQSKANTKM